MGKSQQRERASEVLRRGAEFLTPGFAAAHVAPLIGETPSADCSIAIVRVKRGRTTIRYSFASGTVVYGKAYEHSADGHKLFHTLGSLWKAGFNHAGTFRVPEPLAFLEEEKVVLMGAAKGVLLSHVLAESSLATQSAAVRAVTRWLGALHSAPLFCFDEAGPCERLKIFRETDALMRSASAHPEHAPALLGFLGSVHALAHALAQ